MDWMIGLPIALIDRNDSDCFAVLDDYPLQSPLYINSRWRPICCGLYCREPSAMNKREIAVAYLYHKSVAQYLRVQLCSRPVELLVDQHERVQVRRTAVHESISDYQWYGITYH